MIGRTHVLGDAVSADDPLARRFVGQCEGRHGLQAQRLQQAVVQQCVALAQVAVDVVGVLGELCAQGGLDLGVVGELGRQSPGCESMRVQGARGCVYLRG